MAGSYILVEKLLLKPELAGRSYPEQAAPLPGCQYLLSRKMQKENDVPSGDIRFKYRRCEDRKDSSISLKPELFTVMQLLGALYGCLLMSFTASLLAMGKLTTDTI